MDAVNANRAARVAASEVRAIVGFGTLPWTFYWVLLR